MQHIVTDNGLNYVKAMKSFVASEAMEKSIVITTESVPTPHPISESEDVELSELLEETDKDMVEVEVELEGVDLFPIFERAVHAATTLNETHITHIWLPAHIRCAAHTLNLLATTDTDNTLESFPVPLKQLYLNSMKKTGDIWNKTNRSTKAFELCEQLFGRQLPTPGETRWNSTYDSLKVLLSIDQFKLRTFCEKMQVTCNIQPYIVLILIVLLPIDCTY